MPQWGCLQEFIPLEQWKEGERGGGDWADPCASNEVSKPRAIQAVGLQGEQWFNVTEVANNPRPTRTD